MPYIPHAALLRRPGGGGVQTPVAPSLRRPAFQTVVPSDSPTAACAVAPSKAALSRLGRGGVLPGQMHAGSPPDPVVIPTATAATRPIRHLPETINKATRALPAALEDEKVQHLGRSICAEEDGYFDSKNFLQSKSPAEALQWLLDPSILQADVMFNGTVVQDGTGDLEPVIGQSELLAVPRVRPGRQQEALSAARERSSRRGAAREANGGDMWFSSSWGHAPRDSSDESADVFDSDGTEQDPDSPCDRRRRSFQDALEAERVEQGGSTSSGILADCSSEENGEVGSTRGPLCSSPPPATLSSLASPPSPSPSPSPSSSPSPSPSHSPSPSPSPSPPPTPSPSLSPAPPVRVVRVADARIPLVTKDLSFDDNRPIGVDAAIPAFLRRARAAPPGPGARPAPGHGPDLAPRTKTDAPRPAAKDTNTQDTPLPLPTTTQYIRRL